MRDAAAVCCGLAALAMSLSLVLHWGPGIVTSAAVTVWAFLVMTGSGRRR